MDEAGYTFFGLVESDIYMCNAYIVPEESPYFNQQESDVMSILKEDINKYSLLGDILLIEDLHSGVGLNKDRAT